MKAYTILAAAACVATLSVSASAAIISPVNGSFQSPDISSSSTSSVPNFVKFGNNDRQRVQFNEIGTNPAGGAAIANGDGDQYLILDDRGDAEDTFIGVYQDLGTIEADFTYTLDLKVAKRSDLFLPGTFSYALVVDNDDDGNPFDDTIVASEDQTDVATLLVTSQGTFLDRVLTFNTIDGNNADLVGENLFVDLRIGNNSGPGNADQIAFDNLVVTSTPVPEPTAAVAALAGVGTLLLRRRK